MLITKAAQSKIANVGPEDPTDLHGQRKGWDDRHQQRMEKAQAKVREGCCDKDVGDGE